MAPSFVDMTPMNLSGHRMASPQLQASSRAVGNDMCRLDGRAWIRIAFMGYATSAFVCRCLLTFNAATLKDKADTNASEEASSSPVHEEDSPNSDVSRTKKRDLMPKCDSTSSQSKRAKSSGSQSSPITINDDDLDSRLQRFQEMGFPVEDIIRGLQYTNNDFDSTLMYLTGELMINGDAITMEPDAEAEGGVGISDDSTDPPNSIFPVQAARLVRQQLNKSIQLFSKDSDSLKKCLETTIDMLEAGTFIMCEQSIEFLERMLPELASRLVNSAESVEFEEVHLRTIGSICLLIIKLCALRLRFLPASTAVSRILSEVLCLENRFHKDTKKLCVFPSWEGNSENENETLYADHNLINVDFPHGPYTELLEQFGRTGGFAAIRAHFKNPDVPPTIEDIRVLLQPLPTFIQYVKPDFAGVLLRNCLEYSGGMIDALEDKQIRSQCVRNHVKMILAECRCLAAYSFQIEADLEQCRLDFLLKCMRSSQLDAKMYALTELGDTVSSLDSANFEENTRFSEWLKKNNILDIVLSGNMDQTAYVEKIRPVLSYMAKFFNDKDITYVWSLRKGRMGVSGDNFGQILLYVASGFDAHQIHTLIGFFNKCFKVQESRMIDRIFCFCHDIGIQTKKENVSELMASTMWDLLQRARQIEHNTRRAVEVHAALIEQLRKGHLRDRYIQALLAKIAGKTDPDNIYVNLLHLFHLIRINDKIDKASSMNFCASSVMNRRLANGTFEDWDTEEGNGSFQRCTRYIREVALVNALVDEIVLAHNEALKKHASMGEYVLPNDDSLDSMDSSITGTVTDICMMPVCLYCDYGELLGVIFNILSLLTFKRIDAMDLSHLRQLWDLLILDDSSSDSERNQLFEWLTNMIREHDEATRRTILEWMCELPVGKFTIQGFDYMIKLYQQMSPLLLPEGSPSASDWHMMGIETLWRILMETEDPHLVEKARESLISSVVDQPVNKNKKPGERHRVFLEQCSMRLDVLRRAHFDHRGQQASPGSLLKRIEEIRTGSDGEINSDCLAETLDEQRISWTKKVQCLKETGIKRCIERVLTLIYAFVEKGDCDVKAVRATPPHGSSFFGTPLDLFIKYDKSSERVLCDLRSHSKETISSLKTRIKQRFNLVLKSIRGLHVYREVCAGENDTQEIPVNSDYDWKTLEQLGICVSAEEGGFLGAREIVLVVKNKTSRDWHLTSAQLNLAVTADMQIPGMIITKANNVFHMLNQLFSIDCVHVRAACRRLMLAIPTDPESSTIFTKLLSDPAVAAIKLNEKFNLDQPYILLYTLETLYSRLLPVSWEPEKFRRAEEFANAAVRVGLVPLLLQLLTEPQNLPPVPDTDRLCIFEIAHNLLLYLLTGDSRLHVQQNNEKKAKEINSAVHLGSIDPPRKPEMNLSDEEFIDVCRKLCRYIWCAVGGWLRRPGRPITNGSTKDPIFCKSNEVNGSGVGCSFWASGDAPDPDPNPNSFHSSPHASIVTEQPIRLAPREEVFIRRSITLLFEFVLKRVEADGNPEKEEAIWTSIFIDSKQMWTDVLVNSVTSKPYVRDVLYNQLRCHRVIGRKPVRSALLKFMYEIRMTLPFWIMDGSIQLNYLQRRQLAQCDSFFSLYSNLLTEISLPGSNIEEQAIRGLMLKEVEWILGYKPAGPVLTRTELTMVAGHLQLLAAAIQLLPDDQTEIGGKLIKPLIMHCLFNNNNAPSPVANGASPAPAKSPMDTSDDAVPWILAPFPSSSKYEARQRALNLLCELCSNSMENAVTIVTCLQPINQQVPLTTWNTEVNTAGCHAGLVGLRNDGGTCYMNSVLQQMFFIPGIARTCLTTHGIDPTCNFEGAKGTLFIELQKIFAHLSFSQKEAYVPRGFWETFRFFDEERLDTKQQHDCVDFFTALVDKVDTVLEKQERPLLFKPRLGGKFSYEYICYGCWHRYTGRDEEFMCVNLELHGISLEECFQHYVDGEILEGDNAYKCEKCNEKRATLRRGAFRQLPDTLTIQLKRFSYDYTGRQARKNDDFISFPKELDMTPFTCDAREVSDDRLEELFESVSESLHSSSAQRVPHQSPSSSRLHACSSNSPAPSPNASFHRLGAAAKQQRRQRVSTLKQSEECHYELVGVLAHHGLAAAGHYYSYIKERRPEYKGTKMYGQWIEANDTKMSEFCADEDERANAWFGGSFTERARANSINGHVELPKHRTRTWNAYVLFYDRVKEHDEEQIKSDDCTTTSTSVVDFSIAAEELRSDASPRSDRSLNDGDPHLLGVFEAMPQNLKDEVANENAKFSRERELYTRYYIELCERVTQSFLKNFRDAPKLTHGDTRVLSNLQEQQLKTVAEFYMWWCLFILWRLNEDLCQKHATLEPSMRIFMSLLKECASAAQTLLNGFVLWSQNLYTSWLDLFDDICILSRFDVRAMWWDNTLPLWMQQLASWEETMELVVPSDTKNTLFHAVVLRINELIRGSATHHRLRFELMLHFMQAYCHDPWAAEHFVLAGGLSTVMMLIYEKHDDAVYLFKKWATMHRDSMKGLFKLYFKLLRVYMERDLEIGQAEVFKEFESVDYWKIAIEHIAYAQDLDGAQDFAVFSGRLMRRCQLYITPFVDAICLVTDAFETQLTFVSVLHFICETDRNYACENAASVGFVIRNTLAYEGDERFGVMGRLEKWVERKNQPTKVNEFCLAYKHILNSQYLKPREFEMLWTIRDRIDLFAHQAEEIVVSQQQAQAEALDLSTRAGTSRSGMSRTRSSNIIDYDRPDLRSDDVVLPVNNNRNMGLGESAGATPFIDDRTKKGDSDSGLWLRGEQDPWRAKSGDRVDPATPTTSAIEIAHCGGATVSLGQTSPLFRTVDIAANDSCERPPRPAAPTPPIGHQLRDEDELDEIKPVVAGGPEDDMFLMDE